jgi:hypothetical protein
MGLMKRSGEARTSTFNSFWLSSDPTHYGAHLARSFRLRVLGRNQTQLMRRTLGFIRRTYGTKATGLV